MSNRRLTTFDPHSYQVKDLLNHYMGKFRVAQMFNTDEVAHWWVSDREWVTQGSKKEDDM